jgi:hypothetical protein
LLVTHLLDGKCSIAGDNTNQFVLRISRQANPMQFFPALHSFLRRQQRRGLRLDSRVPFGSAFFVCSIGCGASVHGIEASGRYI